MHTAVISWRTRKTAEGFRFEVYSFGYQIPTTILKTGICATRAQAANHAKRWTRFAPVARRVRAAMTTEPQTVTELRARIEAAKAQAMAKFEADWGTRDVQKVVGALRKTIPRSASPADAAAKARALIGKVAP